MQRRTLQKLVKNGVGRGHLGPHGGQEIAAGAAAVLSGTLAPSRSLVLHPLGWQHEIGALGALRVLGSFTLAKLLAVAKPGASGGLERRKRPSGASRLEVAHCDAESGPSSDALSAEGNISLGTAP